jgi:hypothetical protein
MFTPARLINILAVLVLLSLCIVWPDAFAAAPARADSPRSTSCVRGA